jgi:hypothetical protein
VFCCDGYRIAGELQVVSVPPTARAAPPALPCAVAQPRRSRLTRVNAQNVIAFLIFFIVMAWYGWRLPPPHH